MALVIADRVRETTTTTGTGAVTLAGAYTSFQSFLAAVGNGNSTYYTIASAVTGEWEVGIGTYTSASNTLSRTTVLASSNAGSLVNFSSGAKDVFVTQPAERSILVQSAGSGLFSGVAAFTANGVPYANSTSTLTTGSALTFDGTNLAAAGRVRAGGTSALGLSNVFEAQNTSYGNLAAFRSIPGDGINPYLLITSSADGITLEENGSAYGALMFKTNASEQMRLTGTGLGIGASSFSSKLSVQTTDASAWSPNSTTGTQFIYNAGVLNSASATTHYQVIYGDATTGGVKAGAVASASYSADFVIANRNVGTYQENLRLTYNGNLGLGVTPSAWTSNKALQIGTYGAIEDNSGGGGGIALFGNAYEYSNGAYKYLQNYYATLYRTYAGQHQWFTAPSGTAGSTITFTQAMTLDASGNLGIGTSSPGSFAGTVKAVVGGGSGNPVLTLYGGNSTYGGIYFADGTTGNELYRGFFEYNHSTDSLLIGTAASTKATLDSSGNLALGVAPSAFGGTYKGFQIGQGGLMSRTGGSDVYLLGNNYYDGTNFRYINTSFASRYQQDSGAHSWFTAPSGTAGNAITFTQAMTLDASGNLGIGTSSPGAKLDVVGLTKITASQNLILNGATGTYSTVQYNGTSIGDIGTGNQVYSGGTTTDLAISARPGYRLVLGSNGTPQVYLDSSGNLGLGVTPSAWITYTAQQIRNASVYGWSGGNSFAALAANTWYGGSPAGYRYISTDFATEYYQYQGTHIWRTAASGTAGNAITFTQAMTLDASGDVVIGDTTTNSIRFSIAKNNPTRGILAHIYNLGSSSQTGAQIQFTQNGIANWVIGQPAGEDAFAFWSGRNTATNGAERARIDSSGNLLVGKTATGVGTAGFAAKDYIEVTRDGNPVAYFTRLNSDGDAVQFRRSSGAAVGSISVTTTATAYNTSSDYRLKDNQQPLTGSGAFIDALQPKTWNWKADGSRGVGFIAHEVQEVSPGSVVGEKDGEQMQAMEYGSAEFIANIIAELQSLRKRLAAAGIA